MMTFHEYRPGKYMATNCPVEIDIIQKETYWLLIAGAACDTYRFETFKKAVRFAEHKFGVEFKFE